MSGGLRLLFNGEKVSTFNIDTVVGISLLKKFDSDARYVSSRQFRLFREHGSGKWFVEHDASAQNETLLNGNPLSAPSELSDGDEIAVGNASKNVKKMPLTVRLDEGIAPVPPAPLSPPAHSPTPVPVEDEKGETASASGADFFSWLKSFATATADILGKMLLFVASILGAVLAGMATSSSGRGVLVRRGRSTFGDVILNVQDNKVRLGSSSFGNVVMTIEGEKIYRGNSSLFGEVLAHVDGEKVISGNSMFGDVIAKIDGNLVIQGNSMFGDVIANIENGGRMTAAAAAVYLLLM